MITPTISLCAIPEPLWHGTSQWGNHTLAIHSFVKDALGIEIRIQKGVNQENERSRYNLCCSRLEAAIKLPILTEAKSPSDFKAALAGNYLPVMTLGPAFLEAIRLMYQRAEAKAFAMRLGATFFTPELAREHIAAFEALAAEVGVSESQDVKLRIAFFQFAAKNQCGVVETQNAFHFQEKVVAASVPAARVDTPQFQLSIPEDEGAFDNAGRNAIEILREQVEHAIHDAEAGKASAVNFSNQPHNVITEVLNELAYSDSGHAQKPTYIQVIYADGSQADDLPLACLPTRDTNGAAGKTTVPPLRAALLSMRHLEMDSTVDISWFRNREVSKTRAFSETDRFCYLETKRQLEQTRREGPFVLHLYQTGLQPAVIGFYRALIEELLYRAKQPPSLEVVPFYFRGKSGYQQGRTWS